MNNASNRKEIAFGMFGFLHNGAICSLFSIPFGRFVGWLVRPMVDHIAIFRYRHIVIFIATVPVCCDTLKNDFVLERFALVSSRRPVLFHLLYIQPPFFQPGIFVRNTK